MADSSSTVRLEEANSRMAARELQGHQFRRALGPAEHRLTPQEGGTDQQEDVTPQEHQYTIPELIGHDSSNALAGCFALHTGHLTLLFLISLLKKPAWIPLLLPIDILVMYVLVWAGIYLIGKLNPHQGDDDEDERHVAGGKNEEDIVAERQRQRRLAVGGLSLTVLANILGFLAFWFDAGSERPVRKEDDGLEAAGATYCHVGASHVNACRIGGFICLLLPMLLALVLIGRHCSRQLWQHVSAELVGRMRPPILEAGVPYPFLVRLASSLQGQPIVPCAVSLGISSALALISGAMQLEQRHIDRYTRARVTEVYLWFGSLGFVAMVAQVLDKSEIQRLYKRHEIFGPFILFSVYYWIAWLFGLLLTEHHLRVSGQRRLKEEGDDSLLLSVIAAGALVVLPVAPTIFVRYVRRHYSSS